MASKNNYLNKREMYDAIVAHKEACARADAEGVQRPRVSEYLGSCFWLIASGLGSKKNFAGYPFIEDMIMDAAENCVVAVNAFDHTKWDNPHAYFTKITLWAFFRRIDKEKRTLYVKHKVTEHFVIHNPEMVAEVAGSPEDQARKSLENDYMMDLVKQYEAKEAEGKAKRREKKQLRKRKSGEFEVELETKRRGEQRKAFDDSVEEHDVEGGR